MTDECDMVIVLAGINDYYYLHDLGTDDSANMTELNGALNSLIPGLIDKYPSTPLLFITPVFSIIKSGEKSDFLNYVSAIQNKCDQYGVPCFNLTVNAGMNPRISAQNTAFYKDGIHPNDSGHYRMAEKISLFLHSF
jgi:lysophospholipase L1-like esterase